MSESGFEFDKSVEDWKLEKINDKKSKPTNPLIPKIPLAKLKNSKKKEDSRSNKSYSRSFLSNKDGYKHVHASYRNKIKKQYNERKNSRNDEK
jgi:hypothetical protein